MASLISMKEDSKERIVPSPKTSRKCDDLSGDEMNTLHYFHGRLLCEYRK